MVSYQNLKFVQSKQYKLALQELFLAKEKFKMDSLLFFQKVTSQADFNTAKSEWLQQQRNSRNVETSIIGNEVQINQLNKQITELEIQMIEQGQKLKLALQQARQNALAKITKWKENYLFISPNEGRLSYLGFLETGQFVEQGKPYFSILPEVNMIMAHAEMPLRGSGKVKVGQAVNIRLENYPFEEFGLLRGSVTSISLMPDENKYWVTISLPNQLVTSQHKTLPFKQQLTGTTQIITEDLRLLERFFNQFRKLAQAR